MLTLLSNRGSIDNSTYIIGENDDETFNRYTLFINGSKCYQVNNFNLITNFIAIFSTFQNYHFGKLDIVEGKERILKNLFKN